MGTGAVFAVIVLYFCFVCDGCIESAVKALERQAQGAALEGGQVFDIQMDKPWLGDRFKGLAAMLAESGGSPCHMMAFQAPACRRQGGKSHCVTDFGHGNGA